MLVAHARRFIEFQSHLVHPIQFIAMKMNVKIRHNAAEQTEIQRTKKLTQ